MSDYEFQQARNVSGDQLNYMTVEAQARRAEAIQKEIDRRDAPRRLAEERRALIAQQQAEMVAYERQMAEQQQRKWAALGRSQRDSCVVGRRGLRGVHAGRVGLWGRGAERGPGRE